MLQQALEASLMATSTLYIKPTGTKPKHPSDTAFPTVHPDPPIFQRVGKSGHITLWIVFAIMLISSISFIGLSWRVPASKRLYHTLTTLIVVISTLSYFGMATHSGFSWKHSLTKEEHDHGIPPTFRHVHRQIFFARYIDWILTTPLVILNLSTLGAISGADTLSTVSANIVMVLSGLFSAFGRSKAQRWGWFAFAALSYLIIARNLLVYGRPGAAAKSRNAGRFYVGITGYTLILWLVYVVGWGVGAGTHRFSVNQEIITYSVLDVLAKPIFGLWLLLTIKRLPETGLELTGFWTYGFASEGAIRIPEGEEGA